jgi:ATP-binding cassette subfamily C protein CydD
VNVARPWLIVATAVGAGLTASLVAQAVFLGDLLARLFQPPVTLHDVSLDLLGLAAATVARSALTTTGATAGVIAANRARGRLRHDALAAVLRRGPAWLAGERTGELAVTLGRGLDSLDTYIGDYLPRFVLAGLSPLLLLTVIGVLDWLSLVILLADLSVVPLFMMLIGRLTDQRVARRWAALTLLGAHFLDTVQGLPTLRAYGKARRQESQIEEVTNDLRRTTLAVLRETFLSALVLEMLAAVGTALVAVPLALRLIGGHISLAHALTILLLTPEVFLPLRRASADFHAASEGLSASDRIFELLGAADASASASASGGSGTAGVAGPGSGTAGLAGPGSGAAELATCTVPGPLLVAGLTVTYPDRGSPALSGVELEVAPGERVAVIGPSGAGKSSLLGAIVGLTPMTAGSITLDGHSQHHADPEWWRSQFAYLPQRPRLFSGSLMDNLRLGSPLPPSPARDEELAAVLSLAQLEALVAHLPGGLTAEVGEGGERLSTGERQRVALARALWRPGPMIVVLDEPTAHLDPGTESRIVAALDQWLGGRSLVVASHRARLLELADRVITLDPGRRRGSTKGERRALQAR